MSQRGMKWVFQLDCDSTRYLTISLKGWPDSLPAHSTRFTVLWTKRSCRSIHQILLGSTVLPASKAHCRCKDEVCDWASKQDKPCQLLQHLVTYDQLPATTSHYFLKMISPRRFMSPPWFPYLLTLYAFALPSRPPSVNARPPTKVSYRVSVVILIISRARLILLLPTCALAFKYE